MPGSSRKTRGAELPITNVEIAELFAQRSEREGRTVFGRALRKAAFAAMTWTEEAAELHARGESLQSLWRIGPTMERFLKAWIERPPGPDERAEPPPERRGFWSLAAAKRVVDDHPEWRRGCHGDLQTHTEESDGTVSLEAMARGAIAAGHRYLAITDHSKELRITNGLDEARLAAQGEEARRVNALLAAEGHDFRVIHGVEMNLRIDGTGDLDDACVASLDLVLGTFHWKLREKADQTERYLAALRNPQFQVFAHPRTRMFNKRVGLPADWPRVFAEAAKQGKAVEIDASMDRQDLDPPLIELAVDAGCWFSLSTDAHSIDELEYLDLALAFAIEAGVPRERILNFLPWPELSRWISEARGRAGARAPRP